MADGDKPLEPKWLFYLISFFVPVAGIIIGAIYMSKPDAERKKFGRNCLIAAVAYFVATCVFVILLLFLYLVVIGGVLVWAAAGT